jgi:acyl dehydratase
VRQRHVVASLVRTAMAAAGSRPTAPLVTPGPELAGTVPARSAQLVADYVRHVGGSPSSYRKIVPAHLFPQWGFPLMARTLEQVPYDLTKVLNGGCRMEMNAPIPAGEALELRATMQHIDDNGSRAVLKQQLITGTKSVPQALTATLFAIVPLPKEPGAKRVRKERERVPLDARAIDHWRLGPKAGLEFAMLTGDFNPVHWIAPYARMAGFKNTILHGFSTLARAVESLNKVVFSGDVTRLHTIDVKFVRPLILPAKVGVFVGPEGTLAVGDAPGGPAYLTGTYTLRDRS